MDSFFIDWWNWYRNGRHYTWHKSSVFQRTVVKKLDDHLQLQLHEIIRLWWFSDVFSGYVSAAAPTYVLVQLKKPY